MPPPPVPSIVLSDALLFADPDKDILKTLGDVSQTWQDALVLASPFWELQGGKLNEAIFLDSAIPLIAAASIQFDPERWVRIGHCNPRNISTANEVLLGSVRHVEVEHDTKVLPKLLNMMPEFAALSVTRCEDAPDLSFLESMVSTSLRELQVGSCFMVESIAALFCFLELRRLHLSGCEELVAVDLGPIATLTLLEDLTLIGCSNVTDIAYLSSMATLKKLRLEGFRSVNDVSILGSLVNLEHLDLTDSVLVPDVAALADLRFLKTLILKNCYEIKELNVASLTQLTELDLNECCALERLDGLATTTKLQKLDLGCCNQVHYTFGSMESLKELTLSYMWVTDLSALTPLKSLEVLDVSGCATLENMGSLSGMKSLKKLNVKSCLEFDRSQLSLLQNVEILR